MSRGNSAGIAAALFIVIDGIAYDTDTASEVFGEADDFSSAWWGLYRTVHGVFFKIVVGHDGDELLECKTLTNVEARAALEKHANHLVEKYFGQCPNRARFTVTSDFHAAPSWRRSAPWER